LREVQVIAGVEVVEEEHLLPDLTEEGLQHPPLQDFEKWDLIQFVHWRRNPDREMTVLVNRNATKSVALLTNNNVQLSMNKNALLSMNNNVTLSTNNNAQQ